MPKRKNPAYDDLVRNRLREILSSRKWSVSRFASRYVEKYAERYSRMEAPSTSTARKLIEDTSHHVNEKESLVLDDLFQQGFYQMWLDEQRMILIDKHNQHALKSNESSQVIGNEIIDSETLFHSRIKNVNRNADCLTVDDIAGLIRRYLHIEGSMPFVIFSTSDSMFESVVRDTLPDVKILSPRRLAQPDYNEFDLSVCSIAHQVDEVEYDDFLSQGIGLAKEGKKVILGVIISFEEDLEDLISKYDQKVISLGLPWSNFTIDSWMKTPNMQTLSFKNSKSVKRCIEVRKDLPDWFKDMIRECLNSKWVRWPDISGDGAWMRYIDKIYGELKCESPDFSLSEAVANLMEHGIPANWMLPECDRVTLLNALSAFKDWKEGKDDSVVKRVLNSKFELLMTTGNAPSKNVHDWREWLECQYNFCLVDYEYDALLDVAMTLEKRKKSR